MTLSLLSRSSLLQRGLSHIKGWLQIYCVAKHDLECLTLLPPITQVLELQMCLLRCVPLCLFSTGGQASGFVLTRQAVYQLSCIPKLVCKISLKTNGLMVYLKETL